MPRHTIVCLSHGLSAFPLTTTSHTSSRKEGHQLLSVFYLTFSNKFITHFFYSSINVFPLYTCYLKLPLKCISNVVSCYLFIFIANIHFFHTVHTEENAVSYIIHLTARAIQPSSMITRAQDPVHHHTGTASDQYTKQLP